MTQATSNTINFSADCLIIVPDAEYKCSGAYLSGGRDGMGKAYVTVSLAFGKRLIPPDPVPTHGQLLCASAHITADAARLLAKELMKFADEAEGKPKGTFGFRVRAEA